MSKYRIKAKRDFGRQGFLINGEWVKRGFVVVDASCTIINVMPGATWFQTIGDAMDAIEVLERTKSSTDFWVAMQWKRDQKSQRAA